jgi:hypothetical protein
MVPVRFLTVASTLGHVIVIVEHRATPFNPCLLRDQQSSYA